ncbi:unnamed protein product [Arctia plantaginis]|uniref:GATA zinc finger domain-containing protein 14-like n=1 Tax=Arctia plantaginis TaxID=874455 RepID=A0A8S0ZW53_ARCPL|nr:unnamed protein product [Arctia plantaginis]
MKFVWILCVLTTVTFCDASLLEGILNGAHEAAGAFLGGLTSGVHFGFNAQGGHQRYPPRPNGPHRPGKPETVVVVVEDEPDQPNIGRPGQLNTNGYGNFNKPRPNNGFDQNPYQHQNENGYQNQNSNNFNQNGNWNNHNHQNGPGQYGNQNLKPNHQLGPNPNNHQINPSNPQNPHSSNNQNNQYDNSNNRPINPNNQYGNANNGPLNSNSQYGKPNNQPTIPNNQFGNSNNQHGNTNNRPLNPNSQYGNPNNQPTNPNNQFEYSNNQQGNFNNQGQHTNSNNFGDVNRPSYSTIEPNQGRPNNQEQNEDHTIGKPPVDNTMKFPGQINQGSSDNIKQNNNEHKTDIHKIKNNVENSTKDPTGADEYPLFLPLSPNEYQYGGDKIDVNGPKRDADNSKPKPADDDEEFQIDIRIDNK